MCAWLCVWYKGINSVCGILPEARCLLRIGSKIVNRRVRHQKLEQLIHKWPKVVFAVYDGKRIWQGRRPCAGAGSVADGASGRACTRKRQYYRISGQSEAFTFLCPYAPHRFSWWIGLAFAVGSAMFLATSIWLIVVDGIDYPFFVATIMPFYVVGGVSYLGGAYLMVLEVIVGACKFHPLHMMRPAANWQEHDGNEGVEDREHGAERNEDDDQDESVHQRPRNFCCIFQPRRIDWWASYAMFIGSIVFKLSLIWLFFPPYWFAHIRAYYVLDNIWFVIGTIGFVLGSYLQYAEVVHSWCGVQCNLEFVIVVLNLAGSIMFMGTAIFGIAASQVAPYTNYVYQGTFALAVSFFLVGGYLQMVEAAFARVQEVNNKEQRTEQEPQRDHVAASA